jgi:hypothetical protein
MTGTYIVTAFKVGRTRSASYRKVDAYQLGGVLTALALKGVDYISSRYVDEDEKVEGETAGYVVLCISNYSDKPLFMEFIDSPNKLRNRVVYCIGIGGRYAPIWRVVRK